MTQDFSREVLKACSLYTIPTSDFLQKSKFKTCQELVSKLKMFTICILITFKASKAMHYNRYQVSLIFQVQQMNCKSAHHTFLSVISYFPLCLI